VTIVVRDHGAWRRAGTEDRGRGIPLMRALMEDVRIERRPEGTEVTLRRRLRASAPATA
jgi:anti-sigma regulatory factor (Ser/Thr protein kinase)